MGCTTSINNSNKCHSKILKNILKSLPNNLLKNMQEYVGFYGSLKVILRGHNINVKYLKELSIWLNSFFVSGLKSSYR